MVYTIYKEILLSYEKKEILTLATTWTIRALCKWVNSDRERQVSYDIIYMWDWKKKPGS